MTNEEKEFIDALESYVRTVLQTGTTVPDYNADSVRIVDARNHLFATVKGIYPDEAAGIYPLRGLCRVDEETLEMLPDRQRMAAVARDYFSPVATPHPFQ